MSFYKTYIVAKVQEAIDNLSAPTDPAVAPESSPIFPNEIMHKLEGYKDKAIGVSDFESFMTLLETVANDLRLNPSSDFEKIASVLNRYRRENNLEPL
jgi:hypothetical protein